jgi:hypothetical protein
MLARYFDGACFNKTDGLLSVFFPGLVYSRNASKVIKAFHERVYSKEEAEVKNIHLKVYSGNCTGVVKMVNSLKPLQQELFSVVLHGSLASGEQIPYSDFDGLIIVRNEVFEDRSRFIALARAISQSRIIMHEIDPFQHHGWFILTCKDLEDYPSAFLPLEVLEGACTLLGEQDLTLCIRRKPDYYTPVKNMCRRVRKLTLAKYRPKTMYQLKSLMSEFMLLPALYLQARDQKGVQKKHSFKLAASDFNPKVWSIMDEVSELRASWPQAGSNGELRNFRKIGYIWMQYRKRKGPLIPGYFSSRLNDDFYCRMAELANQVEVNLFR